MSPSWWKRLWLFLWSALVAGVESFIAEQKRIQGMQDKGASDQRDADKKEDEKLAQEAGELKDEIDKASDSDVRARLRKWVRPDRQGDQESR